MSTRLRPVRITSRRKATVAAGVAVLAACALTTFAGRGDAAASIATYLNPHAPIAQRVADLLHQMTLAEKGGQMDQQLVTTVTDTSATCGDNGWNDPNPTCEQHVLVDNH